MPPTRGLHGAQSPYLARESELERLQHRLEQARDGRGSLVIVRGPGGTGTTRTAHEVAARADRLGMVGLWGRSFEDTCGRPYGALAEAFEEYGAGLDAAGLAAQLGADAPPLTRLAPRLSQSLAELRPAAPLEPREERLRLHSALVGWLSRASEQQPLLFVIDDIQWADGDSLRILHYVARSLDQLPVLVLAGHSLVPHESTAGDEADSLRTAIEELPVTEVIELHGLDEGATAAALVPFADEPIDGRAVALIQEVTGGEPLWARELFSHLREENRLDGVHGRGLPEAADLPETLEQLVAWRTSRLGPEVRTVLTALAAFHDGAGPVLLAEVSGLSRGRLVEYLEVAVRRGLARSTNQGQLYAIAHDRLRLALLAALAEGQRAQLHRRVAETLEAELAGRVREHAGELLHHYARSAALEGAGRGVRHGLLAAEQSRSAYAQLRAAACLEACVALATEGDRQVLADLVGRLAQAQAEAGLDAQAVASTGEALRLQRQLGMSPSDALEQLVVTLRALRGDGLDDARQTRVEELRRLGLESASRAVPLTRARLELLVERWETAVNGSVGALVWSSVPATVSRPVQEAGSESDLAELLAPQRLRTRDESALAARHARTWRQPAAVLRAMQAVVTDLVTRHGLFREGASWAGLYLSTSERYGSRRDRLAAQILLGRCQAVLGYLAEARTTLERAGDDLTAVPEPGQLPDELLLSEMVVAHYADGDWTALAERAAGLTAGPRPAGLALAAETCLAWARAGAEERARLLLPKVLDACAQLPPLTFYRDAALISALDAAWELGAAEHSARGRALLDLAIAGQVGGQATGTLRLAKARMFALAGDVEEARSFFAEDRPLLEEVGLRPLRAIVDHDEGLAIAAAGGSGQAVAARLLDAAGEQFKALGMSGWASRTRDLLERGFDAALRPGGRLHFTYPLGLSRREADLVRLVSGGTPLADAALTLELAEEAAGRYLASAMDKLEVADQADLPRTARRYGLGGGV